MSGPDLDESARLLVLDTMRGHVVRESQSMQSGYRWACRCGESSALRRHTAKEHQAQAVLDALRAAGWRSPHTIDGEIVETRALPAT